MDGEPRTAVSTFTQLLTSVLHYCFFRDALRPQKCSVLRLKLLSSVLSLQVHCSFTSTETIRTIMDRKPRTVATSTFTQLLTSEFCDGPADKQLGFS